MKHRENFRSGVDWVDLEKEALYIRDRNLLSLIRNSDYVETIYHIWLHKKPAQNQKRMLNAVLVSFCGGWSITVPVIMSARLAATTKAPIAQCLAAGFCAGGPAHTSAIHEIMKVYQSVGIDEIDDFVYERIEKGERVPGFGHPILGKDPRPPVLRKLYGQLKISGEAIRKYDRIEMILKKEKKIFGNIDGINGAIITDLGFSDPSYGPAFFLMSRSLAMTAHIIEEYRNGPFKALDIVFPGFEKLDYEHKGALKNGRL
jgi:citrate synthase